MAFKYFNFKFNEEKMKKMFVAILLFLFVHSSFSQQTGTNERLPLKEDKTGFSGLSAILGSNQSDIAMPFWVGSKLVMMPAIGISYGENINTVISFGLAAKFFYNDDQKVRPYFSPKFLVFHNSPSQGISNTDFGVGVGLGAEYFLDTKFSLGLEAQLNYIQARSISYINQSYKNINTGSVVFACFYF